MAENTRFVTLTGNRAVRATPTSTNPRLANGNGAYTGAPALVEDAAFPMANILNRDRYSPWQCPAGGTNSGNDVLVDLDLGSNITIAAFGLLGFRPLDGVTPLQCEVSWRNAASYVNTGYTADLPVLSLTGRDPGNLMTTTGTRTARYWRFRFINTLTSGGFTLGKFMLAQTVQDLGFVYSGADETSVLPRVRTETGGGNPTITNVGDEYRLFSIRLTNVRQATKLLVAGVAAQQQPFVMFDSFGRIGEYVLLNDSFTRQHVWSPPDLWSMQLDLRQLA